MIRLLSSDVAVRRFGRLRSPAAWPRPSPTARPMRRRTCAPCRAATRSGSSARNTRNSRAAAAFPTTSCSSTSTRSTARTGASAGSSRTSPRSLGGGSGGWNPVADSRQHRSAAKATTTAARHCNTGFRGHARRSASSPTRAASKASTWQSQRGQVYVSGGCRGEFTAGAQVYPPIGGGNGNSIRCESDNGRSPHLRHAFRRDRRGWCASSPTRAASKATPGNRSTGRSRSAAAAAANSRRARRCIRRSAATATIRCESDNGRSRTCRTSWQGASRLVRQAVRHALHRRPDLGNRRTDRCMSAAVAAANSHRSADAARLSGFGQRLQRHLLEHQQACAILRLEQPLLAAPT